MCSFALALLFSVMGAHAQPITAESRDATEEEEALIRQGFIFFPPLRVRTDEQLQQLARDAAQKKTAEEARKQAAQEAQARAEKAKAEAELAAKQLEERRAQLQAEEAARALAVKQAAELKAREEAEEAARKQAAQEAQARAEKAKAEAELAAKQLEERRAQLQAEEAARALALQQAAELKARQEAAEEARKQAAQEAQVKAEKAKAEAELAAKQLEERRAQLQAEEAARALALQQAAELKARQEAAEEARKQASQEAQARAEKAKAEAELAAKQLEERRAQLQAEEAARALAARQAARLRDQEQSARDQIKRAELQAIQAQAEKTKQEADQAIKDLEDRSLRLKADEGQRQLESRRSAELRAQEDAKSMADKQAALKALEDALKAKAEAEKAKEEAEKALKLLNERRVQIEELRLKKLAEQKVQEQAKKMAKINQQAQIEAEESAQRLAARQAQRLKQNPNPAPNQQVANNRKQGPPEDQVKQSSFGAAVVQTIRNLQQGKWVHNDEQQNMSLSKDSFFFQRFADQGLKYSLGIESGNKGGNASLNFDVGVVRQPFSYGAYVGVKDKALDIGVNAVWSQAPFAYGLAIGQQHGEEVYQYFSGPENTKVSNNNYLMDFAYSMDLNYIKNIGLSYWRSTGKQRESLSPVLIDIESDLYIDTYLDYRKLSPGTLSGYSIRAQGTLPFNSNYRLNLGQESLIHQYWSGVSDKKRKSYLDIDLKHYINDRSALGLGYKKGVAEDVQYFDYINGNWRIRLDNKKSINQPSDNIGIGIYYEQDFGSVASAKVNDSVRAQSIDVSKKPSQFPDGFLVKVDPTAIVLQSRLVKGVIQLIGATSLGIFNDLIEPSRRNIKIQIPLANTNGEPINVELLEGQLPPGLNLSASGLISGTAAAVAADTVYRFKIAATSKGAQPYRAQEFSITIKSPQAAELRFSDSFNRIQFAIIMRNDGRQQASFIGYNNQYFAIQNSDGAGGILARYSDSFDKMYLSNDGYDYEVELLGRSGAGEVLSFKDNGVERVRIITEFLEPIYVATNFPPGLRFSTGGTCGAATGFGGTPREYLMGANGAWTDSCGDYGVVVDGDEVCTGANGSEQGLFDGVVCWMRTSRDNESMLIGVIANSNPTEYIQIFGEDDNPGYLRRTDFLLMP